MIINATITRDGQDIRTTFSTDADRYTIEYVEDEMYYVTKLKSYEMRDIVVVKQ